MSILIDLNGRKLVWPRGECIGGSSAINGLVYKRGHKNDFDNLSNEWLFVMGVEQSY